MSRLEQATERLQSAIERLDRAVSARAGQGEAGADDLRAALERERTQLRSAAAQASERLDAAIARLRAMMGD